MKYYNALDQSQKLLSLSIKPSYLLACIYSMLGLFAGVCILYLPIILWLKCLLIGFIFCFCGYVVCLHALLLHPFSIVMLTLDAKNTWLVKNRAGETFPVMINLSSFVAPYLTVVNFRVVSQKKLHSVLIFPQRVEQDGFRKLRILLRWTKM